MGERTRIRTRTLIYNRRTRARNLISSSTHPSCSSFPSSSQPISIQPTLISSNNLQDPYLKKPLITPSQLPHDSTDGCIGLHRCRDNKAKCAFVRSNSSSAYYFCSSLENLSRILKLSPTIAGVTLLALGNGAPDVFSSIVSFLGPGASGIGFNSILGGAFFVSSGVVGIISISVSSRRISVDKASFVRDVCFFLLTISCLLVILIVGRINIWGAIGFASLYVVYVSIVSTTHFCRRKDRLVSQFGIDHLLPISNGSPSDELAQFAQFSELGEPLLGSVHKEEFALKAKEALENDDDERSKISWYCFKSSVSYYLGWILYILELPLYLPRRLTIPVVCEERWSKPFAVISVTLAPTLLTALWCTQKGDLGFKVSLIIYLCGGLVGIVFGIVAFVTTDQFTPPKRFLFPWLAGGFLMSVIWTYITAEELVALLLALGNIIGISPSILGLTVLAWGNSVGDLIANVAMAINGGSDGVQIAISGCYAGPIFNTLVGLGLSLVISSWHVYPSCYVISVDASLYQILGFLVGGLLWSLMILPRKDMRLNRVLGGGLLAIYLCFLSVRAAYTVGLIQLHGFHG
ncbi:Sodium/calcium exchanger membrane region [Cinnamomum micranthum f. kanehirae]|uniref:Sodium/calcium exchanger membrane region n=1 Tax=Cinnamomum micranthum f. kanehirae TaxID=337451 RepID=A0A3S3MB93_9MAGN|nr:Sodium/calcium exchanger membrane region [Cinnamomum micranthum f. kanehirae]